MPRKPMTYRDASTYCVQFLGELADAPHTHSVYTNPCTRAEAMQFRKQLYKWRFLLKQALSDPTSPDHAEAVRWLTPIVGARHASRDWLDLVIFQIVQGEPDRYRVRATAQTPMFGPDPFATPSRATGEARAMIASAQTMPRAPLFDFATATPAERLAHARRIADGTTD